MRLEEDLRRDALAQREEQGLPAELTDEQYDAIGAVWASRPRPRSQEASDRK